MAERERRPITPTYPGPTGELSVQLIATSPIMLAGGKPDEEARQHRIFAFPSGAHILSVPNSQPPCQAKEG